MIISIVRWCSGLEVYYLITNWCASLDIALILAVNEILR